MTSTPEKPFSYTAKNTPRRLAIIKEYEEEINALYDAVDESTQTDLTPPPSWNITAAREYIRTVIGRVMDLPIGDTEDLFACGCDRYVTERRLRHVFTFRAACKQHGYATLFFTHYVKQPKSTPASSRLISCIDIPVSPNSLLTSPDLRAQNAAMWICSVTMKSCRRCLVWLRSTA